LERSDNPGTHIKKLVLTLKGFLFRQTLAGLIPSFYLIPRVVADSNPGLRLANAFGVLR
jgi:hypothetical protein